MHQSSLWISVQRKCHFSSNYFWTLAAPSYCKLLMHKITESSGPYHHIAYSYFKTNEQTDFLLFKLPSVLGWQESLTTATSPATAERHKRVSPDLFLFIYCAHHPQWAWLARSKIVCCCGNPAFIHSTCIYWAPTMCKVLCCLVYMCGKSTNMINPLKNLKSNGNYYQLFSASCVPGTALSALKHQYLSFLQQSCLSR